MTEERLTVAIGRLERAIAGLEQRLPDRLAAPAVDADATLRQRHEALRARTAAAVERLSQLLEPGGEA